MLAGCYSGAAGVIVLLIAKIYKKCIFATSLFGASCLFVTKCV